MSAGLDAQAIGWLVLSLAALLGMAAGCVGLFVLRVEFTELVRRVRSLERQLYGGPTDATD